MEKVRNEAKRLANENETQNFIRTDGWFYRIMKMEGLSMRTKTSIAQRMPTDYGDKIVKFPKFVIHDRKRTL